MTLTEKELIKKLEIATYAVSEEKMKAIIDVIVDWNVYISMREKSLKNAERIMFPIATFLEKINSWERWLIADKLELTIENIKNRQPKWKILIEWYDEIFDDSLILSWWLTPQTILVYKPEIEREIYNVVDFVDTKNKRYLMGRRDFCKSKNSAIRLITETDNRERISFEEAAKYYKINEWIPTTLSEALRIWYWVKEKDVLIIT